MADYPYIQKKTTLHNETCETCKEVKENILYLEWRVDYFQGNCEFEKICNQCLVKRTQEAKRREREYIKKMTPIWDAQRKKQENREAVVREMIARLGLEIKEYANGQWSIGGKLDWWTTTGTAMDRKTRKQYHFSFKNPKFIEETLLSLTS